jgi:hypothetical protein
MKDVIVKVKAKIEEKIAMNGVAAGAKRISRAPGPAFGGGEPRRPSDP